MEGPAVAAQTPTYPDEAATSLSMAIVASSPGPLLLLDGDLVVIAASASFSTAFDIDVESAPGNALSRLGDGEWDAPQLRSLLHATASGAAKIEAYEMDLKRRGQVPRRLVIHAQRLVYQDVGNMRLLMAVTDVTDARADATEKDEVLRQNLVLLQEVRHRVANSLQIIASVLMQNARKTASDETRGHLKDAHNRVMSVAALERQLAGSGEPHVELHAYFTDLCDSIAASMIADSDELSLVVAGAPGVVDARVSMSLGLIVTELAINALKHAFPEHRHGTITVQFEVHGPNWNLSVTDDGVGMPTDPSRVRTGLGTSIVQALAKQLSATVEISSAEPGTRVAINHTQIALVDEQVGRGATDTRTGRASRAV
jgi:two-component sensor histidine kinase